MYKLIKVFKDNRNFFLLWFAQILTQTAVSIFTINIGILSHEGVISSSLKESSTSIGIIVDLSTLPGFFIAPLAGVLADRFDKKKIMIYSNILRFWLLGLYTLRYGWQNMWLSYSLVFILSMILQFFIPAEGGIIPKIVSKKYLLIAHSLFSLTVYSTMAIGVAFSGLFLNVLGVKTTFVICSLLFIISTLLVRFVEVESMNNGRIISKTPIIIFIRNLYKSTKEGISYAFSKTKLRFALIHLFLIQIAGLTLVTIVFRIGDEIYGVSPRSAGIVVFAPIVVGLIIGLAVLNIYGRQRNRIKLILLGTMISSIGFILMAIIALSNGTLSRILIDKLVANLSLLAVGVSLPFLLIPAQTLMHENTEDKFRGRILGIWVALTSSLASLFATLIGFLTDRVGDIYIAVLLIVFADLAYSSIIIYLIKKNYI